MPKFIVAHRKDYNNVGDIASNPLQYFVPSSDYETIDIIDLGKTAYPAKTPIIVGGGGLIFNEYIGNSIEKIFSEADKNQLEHLYKQRWISCNPDNSKINNEFNDEYRLLIKKYIDKIPQTHSPKFLWGAGHNLDLKREKKPTIEYPSYILNFNLVGIRDYGTEFDWVPCASCMHPALRKNYAIKNDVIWFEHKKQLTREFGNDSIPRFINSGANIDQTIELLGSANVILTNSYHGAYWGTLLKKKVIIVGPWSSKFYTFRHQPYILEKTTDFRQVIDMVPTFDRALDESIAATEHFWRKIQTQL